MQSARTSYSRKYISAREHPQIPPIMVSTLRSNSHLVGSPLSSQPSTPASLAWSDQPTESLSPALLRMEPDSLTDLTESISLISRDCTIGGLGNVSQAIWNRGNIRSFVAVKCFRPQSDTFDSRMEARVRREIIIWSRLQHESIVPLFGTVCRLGNYDVTGLVSAWMAHGNLSDYLVNQLLTIFERIQILCQVANGIEYLHSLNIIHGNISGSNILINENWHACLGDFGMSSIKAEFEGASYWSSTIGGAIRWRAPELLPSLTSDVYNFKPDLTWRCDIYSFGSVMLQVLSNTIPYDYISRNEYVLIELFRRQPPRRPESRILSDEYWKFIKYCWGDAPKTRPLAKDLHTSILDVRDDT